MYNHEEEINHADAQSSAEGANLTDELCVRCDGRGKLRNNRTIDGKYVLGFIVCDECGGSGLFNPKAIHMPYE